MKPARIAFDLQGLQSPGSRNRGIGRYVQAFMPRLLPRLDAAGIQCQLYGSGNLPLPEFPGIENYPLTLLPFPSENGVSPINETLYTAQVLRDLPDVLFLPSPMEGGDSVLPNFTRAPLLLAGICYDLIPYLFADHYLPNSVVRQEFGQRLRNLAGADRVFAISEATRQDTIRVLGHSPDAVFNVSGGVPEFFRPLTASETSEWHATITRKFSITRPFVMYTGGDDWRKNIDGLLDAYAGLSQEVHNNYQLVVACKVSQDRLQHFDDLMRKQGLRPGDVVFTNFVTDEELRALYALCHLFIFPSFYEGFGLPVVEALACGAPVIVGDNSSLIEIVQDKRLRFDAQSAESIRACLTRTLGDSALLQHLRREAPREAARFNWDAVAERIFEGLKDIPARPRESFLLDRLSVRQDTVQASAATLPRLAYFSPLPPLESGIADHSAELLPALSTRFAIDLFTADSYRPLSEIQKAYPTYQNSSWEVRQRHGKLSYNALLYHMGNSEAHTYIYRQMRRYGGITVLHDYGIGGMINHASADQSHLGISLADELDWEVGIERRKEVLAALASKKLSVADFAEHGLWLNRRVFTRSLGVVLHSRATYAQACRERGADNEFITVIPQLMESASEPTLDEIRLLRQKWGVPQNAFVFGSFGFIIPSKRPLLLLQAFAEHRRTHPDAYLLFAGAVKQDVPFDSEVARLGLQDCVRHTGFVKSIEDFTELVRLCDVGVSLRYPSRGETSAALLRLLAQHKPCIVTNVGSFTDYAPSVVHKVIPPTEGDEVASLVEALAALQDNASYRASLAEAAARLIRQEHAPAHVAHLYSNFIDAVMRSPRTRQRLLGDRIGREMGGLSTSEVDARQTVNLFHPLFRSSPSQTEALPASGKRAS